MNDTARALIQATQTCIAEHGIAATTSRAITTRARVNLGSITYYFGSKDDLIAIALIEGFRAFLQPTLDVLNQDGDPGTQTILGVQTLIATLDQHRDQAAAYLEALAQSQHSPAVRSGIVNLWNELATRLESDIFALQTRDELPAWVNPQAMASLLITVATGSVIHFLINDEGPAVGDMAGQFTSLLLTARDQHLQVK